MTDPHTTTTPPPPGRGGSPTGATVLGYPRQGPGRRLKRAVEGHWRGRTSAEELLAVGAELRRDRWQEMASAGLTEVPVGDFSYYDHVLDTTLLLGATPARFTDLPAGDDPAGRLARQFALARGTDSQPPLEMTKWFDTNYHYLVPELGPGTRFALHAEDLLRQVGEARELGLAARPVVLGPVSYLSLAKADEPGSDFDPLTLLDRLVPVYAELLTALAGAGAEWVQVDEPVLVLDQPAGLLERVREVWTALAATPSRPRLLVATYFGALGEAAPVLAGLPVEGLAVDLSAAPGSGTRAANLAALRAAGHDLAGKRLLAGVVDGRNVWRTDLAAALDVLTELGGLVGSLDVSASCSLLHVPLDLAAETSLDPGVARCLAFARQKLAEVALLADGLRRGREAVAGAVADDAAARSALRTSPLTVRPDVRERVAAVGAADTRRRGTAEERRRSQQQRLGLPLLPTTTIGSFPQTEEVRRARAGLRRGELDPAGYQAAMRAEVERVVALQEELGLDVLVHGEPERNDMVQYFAEQLDGFLTTEEGWVQSYGSRYVRPPVVVGDVSRPAPMTVEWSRYAQQLTSRPVKGMLTGPVTMLAWSFGRDDLTPAETATQVALALREEVQDLERAGIAVIQVDEPALRETLPLRRAAREGYLDWAVRAFLLTTAGVDAGTQVHTHMCYAEFGEVLEAIIALDADVISLEAARSRMEVVADLREARYPHAVGPGVWDIHSPRVPTVADVVASLELALAGGVPAERLWVNPDCGLKTRGYAEVEPALRVLVEAAGVVRERLAAG
ncbi:5-methyltetrahydropteroyltriglutamate--homocysteine S-methyltransferase [Auraticoccus sp. F435]|uniref:5-methyltetrahydropteroyltriglutamate--homocysteine methyltransferase n=1 Tax=Auraticoccus cholistanensis TaxID=2656650 RepID=A0A6A9UWB4_9ACTN|nr:5-methyltetrahydropteroyltriglutamate--homocysteine S-methyltransferase [Auraticoccus cholistanensis]MVA77008.1 5-methyltetrahydropteroyltriglutamate--homocysteine S-methyltransferase [Auraticoccus cholistanensis]